MSSLTVTPENMVLAAGASSIIDAVTFLLADPGCSALTPAPYYPMFDQDTFVRNNVTCRPLHLEADHNTDVAVLDAAKRAAESERQPPRFLLIANPDNPTGTPHPLLATWPHPKREYAVYVFVPITAAAESVAMQTTA